MENKLNELTINDMLELASKVDTWERDDVGSMRIYNGVINTTSAKNPVKIGVLRETNDRYTITVRSNNFVIGNYTEKDADRSGRRHIRDLYMTIHTREQNHAVESAKKLLSTRNKLTKNMFLDGKESASLTLDEMLTLAGDVSLYSWKKGNTYLSGEAYGYLSGKVDGSTSVILEKEPAPREEALGGEHITKYCISVIFNGIQIGYNDSSQRIAGFYKIIKSQAKDYALQHARDLVEEAQEQR